jgi:hypothetical protein
MMDFATYMLFQGLNNIAYISINTSDTSKYGSVGDMIRNEEFDTMPNIY